MANQHGYGHQQGGHGGIGHVSRFLEVSIIVCDIISPMQNEYLLDFESQQDKLILILDKMFCSILTIGWWTWRSR